MRTYYYVRTWEWSETDGYVPRMTKPTKSFWEAKKLHDKVKLSDDVPEAELIRMEQGEYDIVCERKDYGDEVATRFIG